MILDSLPPSVTKSKYNFFLLYGSVIQSQTSLLTLGVIYEQQGVHRSQEVKIHAFFNVTGNILKAFGDMCLNTELEYFFQILNYFSTLFVSIYYKT